MHTPQRAAVLLFALLLAAGCGSSKEVVVSYDSEQNRMMYKTQSYSISNAKLDTGLGSSSSETVDVRAVAQCQGSDCTPRMVRLVFKTSGGAELAISGAGGEIVADGTRIAWNSVEAGGQPSRGGGRFYEARGVFATVDLRLDQLEQIASASSADGSIGGRPLTLDADVQSGFQTLLREIRGKTASASASSGT